MKNITCKYCEYEWTPKKKNPVACPRCKNRLDRPARTVALQIGGNVGPTDRVGMHIRIPIKPGTGVKIQLDSQLDKELKAISKKIPADHPKARHLQKIIKEALQEKDKGAKLQKISTIVMIGTGIVKIASEIAKLAKLLGF